VREPVLPRNLVEARRPVLFDSESLPAALAKSHRTAVWAELRVQSGSVRFVDLDEDDPRDLRLAPGDCAVIVPGIEHHIDPSTDATFYVQFYREKDAAMVSASAATPVDSRRRSRQWEHRGRDLDTAGEIFEMVTRQYFDVVQDDLLQPHFNFGPGFIDWRSHIGSVTDYWCHVVLYAPDYEIDVIENHRHLHQQDAFTPELFDRWLQIFDEAVDGGWAGPHATSAKKRAAGMAWVMASRFLGKGIWRPAERR
jgi:hemoglobin